MYIIMPPKFLGPLNENYLLAISDSSWPAYSEESKLFFSCKGGHSGQAERVKDDRTIRLIPLILLLLWTAAPLWVCVETYNVKRVINDDTLLLTNEERVRLFGVDTPEAKHPQKPVERFGKEAYLF